MRILPKVSEVMNTKKILLLVLVCIMCCLCGCDMYVDRRPPDYINTKWVCNDPDIWFEVDDEHNILGEIKINGEVKPITAFFNMGCEVDFYPSTMLDENAVIDRKEIIIKGNCSFRKYKLIVKVNYDTLFNNQYEKLIFIRENKN